MKTAAHTCCIWSPYKQKYKDALENVQRRATKLINGMSEMSYPDRLRKLKLPTLAYRRIRGDMIELYKLIHGNYDRNTPNITNLLINLKDNIFEPAVGSLPNLARMCP